VDQEQAGGGDAERVDETKQESATTREATDPTVRAESGGPGAYGPPEAGAKGDPKRDDESGLPREDPPADEREIDNPDDPEMGQETRGG